ncbi:ulp1 protease family, C-terminal catalytic domain-containing protein [Tanacetum coccineum]
MAERQRQYVYDAKVSIRSKLYILQTIRSKLNWKVDRLGMFSRTVFGPWLNIQTTIHDNHLLNFLLQHQRLVRNPSPNQPFIFDIDGRSLKFGREDFYLITGFHFGKVSFGPQEKDHSEFRKRVFPENANLKGEHLLELVMNDVKFNQLDDEDVVRVCLLLALDYVFMGQELRHVITNAIVNLVDDFYKCDAFSLGEYMWSFFHKMVYNVAVDCRKTHLEKLARSPKYEANYVLYGFVFPLKIWGLETFSNSIHWWRKDENVIPKVFHGVMGQSLKNQYLDQLQRVLVIPRTEVHQEVHVRTEVHRFVDIEEVRTLFVDEEDVQKRVVLAKTVKEQEQMIVDLQRRLYSVKQIIKQLHTGPSDFDLLDKNDNHSHNVPVGGLDHQSMEGVSQCMKDDQNCNNVPDNFPVDGPEYQSVEGVSQCTSVDHVDKKSFVMDDPEFKAKDNEEGSYSDTFLSTQQDVGVSESMNVDQPSLNTVVKDVKTVVVPFQRSYTFPKCTKKTISLHEGVMALFRDKKRMDMQWTFPWLENGHVIRMDFWEKLVGRSHTKRGRLYDDPNDDWAMASPYLSDMLLRYEYPLYYADGVKYGVPWFVNSVKKVYFPVNESDSHWVLGELDITSDVITFYDSLGGPPGGVKTRHFWLEVRQRLEFQFPLYLDSAEVDDSSTVALAWRERIIDFYWRYKILQDGLVGMCSSVG